MVRMAALAAPAVLVTVALFLHGAVAHNRHSAAPVVTAQAGHSFLEPAEKVKSAPLPRGNPARDGRPQPWEHCDTAPQTVAVPLPRSDGPPLRGPAGTPGTFLAATPAAHPAFPRQSEQVRGHDDRPIRVQLQVFRC
jgi:hypothetical protein